MVSPGLPLYLSTANVTGLEEQQAACMRSHTCTKAHVGFCGPEEGGVCTLHGGVAVAPLAPRVSLAMRANPSPDW